MLMPHNFPELPDWSFNADEVSAGVYRAFGRDHLGRKGVNPIQSAFCG